MDAPVTISIIGGTLWGNRGAQAMLETTIGVLRETMPEARFNIFSYYPKKDRELVSDARITVLSATPLSLATRHLWGALAGALIRSLGAAIPRTPFFRITRALAQSDILLDISGITFSDGREKFLLFNILCIWPAMLIGVPVVKMAQALGPFHRRLNRLFARLFLPRCRRIYARGAQSAGYLAELGCSESLYAVTADTAFLFRGEYSLTQENDHYVDELARRLRQNRDEGRKVIIISPSTLVEKESRKKRLDYGEKFFQVIRELCSGQHFFVFMPNATRMGSKKTHNNDLLTITDLRTRAEGGALPGETLASTAWIDVDINAASIRRIISEGDLLVTSRYHAMISGLCLGVPTIVLGWGHKYSETMREFDLEGYSLDFGEKSADLANVIRTAIQETPSIRQKILKNQPKVASLAEKQFNGLKDIMP